MQKVIDIILENGNLDGVKMASTSIIEVIQMSKLDFSNSKYNRFLNFDGIYILTNDLDCLCPEIYVGKGNVLNRLKQHNTKKTFWNTIYAIKPKNDGNFGATYINYMEYYFIDKIKNKIKLDKSLKINNKQVPKKIVLPKTNLIIAEYYINDIEILLPILGFKYFHQIKNTFDTKNRGDKIEDNNSVKRNYDKNITEELSCNVSDNAIGKGYYINKNKFILKEGSICRLESKFVEINKKRSKMLKNKLIKKEQNSYILQKDIEFSSSSASASFVLGYNVNGYNVWKNKNNVSLNNLLK